MDVFLEQVEEVLRVPKEIFEVLIVSIHCAHVWQKGLQIDSPSKQVRVTSIKIKKLGTFNSTWYSSDV